MRSRYSIAFAATLDGRSHRMMSRSGLCGSPSNDSRRSSRAKQALLRGTRSLVFSRSHAPAMAR